MYFSVRREDDIVGWIGLWGVVFEFFCFFKVGGILDGVDGYF